MALTLPTSMDDLLYFTNRATPELKAKAWAYKKLCPKCKKGKMGKPLDEKTGRPKIRSTEYICPNCAYAEEKKAHEDTLTLEVLYTCTACNKPGEGSMPFKRKTYMGVKAFVLDCQHCGAKIAITKKMKDPKKKKGKVVEEEEDDDE
jgi:hypothetical protein